jgi:hypothetical protein
MVLIIATVTVDMDITQSVVQGADVVEFGSVAVAAVVGCLERR